MSQDRIEVSMGYTRNMGKYESMRIDVGYATDSRSGENEEDTYKRAYQFVEKNLLEDFDLTSKELAEAREAEKKKQKEG